MNCRTCLHNTTIHSFTHTCSLFDTGPLRELLAPWYKFCRCAILKNRYKFIVNAYKVCLKWQLRNCVFYYEEQCHSVPFHRPCGRPRLGPSNEHTTNIANSRVKSSVEIINCLIKLSRCFLHPHDSPFTAIAFVTAGKIHKCVCTHVVCTL